mgnify:CR=1 FL=1
MRFVVGASMGLTRYSYPKFLLWDALGGVSWAAFSCVSSYLVASALDDRPILSIAVSAVLTTVLLALLYRRLRQGWEADGATAPTG